MIKQKRAVIIYLLVLSLFSAGCGMATTIFSSAPPPLHFKDSDINYKFTFSEERADFIAGFSKKKITPSSWQWLAGYSITRPSLKTHDDLWAKCIVISDKSRNSLGIVSLDLLGLLPSDVKDIQKKVSVFFPGTLLIHTTHTHSAPDTMGMWGWGVIVVPLFSGRDEGYIRFIKNEVAGCMREAINRQETAMLSFSRTEFSGIAHGPREMKNDESLLLMHVLSKNQSVLLLNYAIHPDLIKSNHISSDFLYYTYDYIEKAAASDVMFINGALGGVEPKDKGEETKRFYRAKEIGTALGRKVIEILPELKISAISSIFSRTDNVSISVKNKKFILASKLGLMPEQRSKDGLMKLEVIYAGIGDAVIITFPGEAFPNIATALKKYLSSEFILTFGLTNGEVGYILFLDDFKSGRYKYHTSMSLNQALGDEIFRTIKNMIIKLNK